MNIVRKATCLFSRNIEKSKTFYQNILDFSVETDLTSVVFFKEGIAIWQIQEKHLLTKIFGKDFFKTKDKTFELYFEIKNWEQFVKKLENEEVNYVHKAHQEPWGQNTIRFYDPDNNIIEVGESLEEFINRLYVNGKTKEEIAKINEITIEEVNKILACSD